jgi:hypothetical protein
MPVADGPLITASGAYEGISGTDYHGVELCPEHSVSGSGLVLIEEESAAHYWDQCIHNPARKVKKSKPHYALGHLVHDLLLYQGMLPAEYHIVPDDFSPAHHKKWGDEMEGYRSAVEAGMNILQQAEFEEARAMAEACDRHELAGALLMAGKPEVTLAAQDPKTGRWVRARPDFLPDAMEIIPDVKTAVSAHPVEYERHATRFGYFQKAAHYLDVIDLVFGEAPAKRRFVHIVIEKGPANEKHYPGKRYPVEIFDLDDGDIHEARLLNRRALDIFDRCLSTGQWPGYSTPEHPVLPLRMAPWKRRDITQRVEAGQLSYE